MSMTALLGLSFGVFPCLLFGFIMLISLLVCEYIEEYVAKHLCAWKNRRRRGLRSFYRDFRDRRDSHTHDSIHAAQHYSSRSRYHPPTPNTRVGGNMAIDLAHSSGYLSLEDGNPPLSPSAPPTERLALHGRQLSGYSSNYQLSPVDDLPPSYEECVLPRVRLQNSNNSRSGNGARNSRNKTSANTTQPKKPSSNPPSPPEQKKDKDDY